VKASVGARTCRYPCCVPPSSEVLRVPDQAMAEGSGDTLRGGRPHVLFQMLGEVQVWMVAA